MNAYILENDTVKPCPNPLKYAKFISDKKNTQIRNDKLNQYIVSTVFIGVGEILFESAIFKDNSIIIAYKTDSMVDAIKTHVSILNQIEKGELL